jgi:hypothetical protein
MKALLLLPMLMWMSVAGYAAEVHVLISNYNSYGQGMICVVDQGYNAQFENLIHASDFNVSRTSKASVLTLMGFFKDVDLNACYVPKGTAQQVAVSNAETVYVVTIVMKVVNGAATNVYWNVTNLNTIGIAGDNQYVTVDAPAL